MSVIDKVKKHFNDQVSNNLQKYHVKEWDLDVYFYPTYSFKEEQQILNASANGDTVTSLVESLIVKARDKDGKRIFSVADKAALMHEADPNVVIKVAGVINNGNDMSDEDIEKN